MTVFKRGSVYKYHFVFNGEHVQRSTRQGNLKVARDMEATHRSKLAKGEVGIIERKSVPTLNAFSEKFVGFVETRNASKPQTIRFYKMRLDRLLEFEPLAEERLDRIDAAELEAYVQYRIKRVSPTTVNRELMTLRRLLNVAKNFKIIPAVPKIQLLKGEVERSFVLSAADEIEYLKLAPQPLKDAAILLIDTGLRVGEAVALVWSDIQLEPVGSAAFGYVRVREGKSKHAKRTVPLTARARLMLEERLRTCDCKPGAKVFNIQLGTSFAHLHTKVRTEMKQPKEFVLHSLRHTFLTRLGEAGADAFTIKTVAGHSSVTISQKYIHPTGEAVERAFERLETLNLTAQRKLMPAPAVAFASATPAAVSASPAVKEVINLRKLWGINDAESFG
jgi:integrase